MADVVHHNEDSGGSASVTMLDHSPQERFEDSSWMPTKGKPAASSKKHKKSNIPQHVSNEVHHGSKEVTIAELVHVLHSELHSIFQPILAEQTQGLKHLLEKQHSQMQFSLDRHHSSALHVKWSYDPDSQSKNAPLEAEARSHAPAVAPPVSYGLAVVGGDHEYEHPNAGLVTSHIMSNTERKSIWKKIRPSAILAHDFASAKIENITVRLGRRESRRAWAERRVGIPKSFREPPNSVFARIVQSTRFRIFWAVLICIDIAYLIHESDTNIELAMAKPPRDVPHSMRGVNGFLVFAFVAEMVMRMAALRWSFFLGHNYSWNVFDLIVTSVSAVAECMENFPRINGVISISILIRGVRVLRLCRAVRAFRWLSSLRIMIGAIVQSATSLIWSFALLTMVTSFFSPIFMGAAADVMRARGDLDEGIVFDLVQHWGSFFTAGTSLFKAVTGGDDWTTYYSALDKISPIHGCIFMLYIFFMIFGVINIIVGVFVNQALGASTLDKEVVIQQEQERMDAFMREIKEIFEDMDVDQDGLIDESQFSVSLEDPRMRTYLQAHNLDLLEPRRFFNLLDLNQSGEVSMPELILGLQHLGGQAKSSDVVQLLSENRRLATELRTFMKRAGETLFCDQQLSRAAQKMITENNRRLSTASH